MSKRKLSTETRKKLIEITELIDKLEAGLPTSTTPKIDRITLRGFYNARDALEAVLNVAFIVESTKK